MKQNWSVFKNKIRGRLVIWACLRKWITFSVSRLKRILKWLNMHIFGAVLKHSNSCQSRQQYCRTWKRLAFWWIFAVVLHLQRCFCQSESLLKGQTFIVSWLHCLIVYSGLSCVWTELVCICVCRAESPAGLLNSSQPWKHGKASV